MAAQIIFEKTTLNISEDHPILVQMFFAVFVLHFTQVNTLRGKSSPFFRHPPPLQ